MSTKTNIEINNVNLISVGEGLEEGLVAGEIDKLKERRNFGEDFVSPHFEDDIKWGRSSRWWRGGRIVHEEEELQSLLEIESSPLKGLSNRGKLVIEPRQYPLRV
ncbi:hypothetical protein TB2_037271 [Malus domestica]